VNLLDAHIADNDAWDEDGQGRNCFVCGGSYGITPGLEDTSGVCNDCAHELIRDALRYRYIRHGRPGDYNKILIFTNDALDERIDDAIDGAKAIPGCRGPVEPFANPLHEERNP
jgi:hypothetical protein